MATKEAAAAATRASLRALGGATVMLRLPGGSEQGTQPAGMGLAAPALADVELSPALIRMDADGAMEILVEAATLEEAAGAEGDILEKLLTDSARLAVGARSRKIAKVSADLLGGSAYLYRLKLEG